MLLLAVPCFADLKFEAEKVELKAKASDEVLKAQFKFKNDSKEEIEITDISVGCTCLKPRSNKKIYAPGESGVVDVDFTLGSFTGYQEKLLTVITEGQRTQLRVGVQIPNVIVITPTVLDWTVGEKAAPKSFKVVVEHDEPINVTDAICKREGFEVEVKEVKKGREYEVVVTPPNTDKAMLGLVTVKTDCKIKKHQLQNAFFAISRPKRAPKSKP